MKEREREKNEVMASPSLLSSLAYRSHFLSIIERKNGLEVCMFFCDVIKIITQEKRNSNNNLCFKRVTFVTKRG